MKTYKLKDEKNYTITEDNIIEQNVDYRLQELQMIEEEIATLNSRYNIIIDELTEINKLKTEKVILPIKK